jgi:hypothetical protein
MKLYSNLKREMSISSKKLNNLHAKNEFTCANYQNKQRYTCFFEIHSLFLLIFKTQYIFKINNFKFVFYISILFENLFVLSDRKFVTIVRTITNKKKNKMKRGKDRVKGKQQLYHSNVYHEFSIVILL